MMISVIQILAKCWCLMYHAVTLSLASPAPHNLNETEVAPSKPRVKPEVVSQQVVNFFNPLTCQPKADQDVSPCHAGGHINQTLCLKHKCCASSKKQILLDCYAPFQDRPQRILRLFGIGVAGVILFACLPFCCCIVERSPCANPLRRSIKEEESEDESSDDAGESDDGSHSQ